MNKTLDLPVMNAQNLLQLCSTDSVRNAFVRLLQSQDAAERLFRLMNLAMTRTPEITQCTARSILAFMLECARYGFEPGDYRGLCYAIPRKNRKTGTMECQFLLGYQGLIVLAYRSGQIASINAECVYSNDEFSYNPCRELPIVHNANWFGDNRGELVGVYAVARLTTGGIVCAVLDRATVERHRASSTARDSDLWTTHTTWAWKKTALRELAKLLPACEMAQLAARDAAIESGEVSLVDTTPLDVEAVEHEEKSNGSTAEN